MAARNVTVKKQITARIGLAKSWLNTAAADVKGNDRLDALDSLRFAENALRLARRSILDTLPQEVSS